MTTKALPPDTAREISALKRRVTDLERLLDRVRRDTARPTADEPPAFAAIYGTASPAGGVHTVGGGWRWSRPSNPVATTVADPTRRITTEADPYGDWTLRVDRAGIYAFGTTVVFDDAANPVGNRYLGVDQVDFDGLVETADLLRVPAADGSATVLSGVAVVAAGAGTSWWPRFGHDTGVTLHGYATVFWGLALSEAEPEAPLGEL